MGTENMEHMGSEHMSTEDMDAEAVEVYRSRSALINTEILNK